MKDVNPPPKSSSTHGKGKLIQDVKSGKALNFDKEGMMGFLKSLNPLQFASETIAQITHYKIQIKNLQTEQIRIQEEAKIRHKQIDSALEAGLQLLEERRRALEIALEVVAKDLENTHLEKQNILDCISNLVKNISDPKLSIEEKQMSNILLPELTGLLKTLGEQSTVKLDLIAQNTQKALEAMPNSDRILTFSED
ncbi:TPA: hypothetical protein RQJ96_004437 [Vibrio vulnificus]|nr:hypothetical protein [Vibrio vulnificus]